MIESEKVIKGLETIKQFFECGLPSTAKMFDSYYSILNDAIAQLKEQGESMKKIDGRYSEDIMDALVNLMKVFLKDHEIYKLMELVTDAVATKEQENLHKTCNPQHSKTVVRYTTDKDGWRVGAYVKDPSMFEHGNNTGK